MAVYQMKVCSILSKVEVTEGTDSTPTASDGFFATVGAIPNPIQFVRNENMSGKGSQLPGVPGPRRWPGIPVSQNLRGSGAAYAAGVKPKADALLRACGFAAAGTFTGGSEKWDYTFRSDVGTFESFSSYIYRGGKLYKCLGSRGLPSLRFALGGFATLSAQLHAMYSAPVDGALVAVTGEPTIGYPIMLSSVFQLGSENFAAKHGEITIDCGRKIVPREDGTAASGFAGMEMVGERTPTITFQCEQTNEAGFGFWTKLTAGTQMDCSFTIGGTQYNRLKATMPAIQFESLEEADRDGLAMYRASCLLVSPTGVDDDLTITFD